MKLIFSMLIFVAIATTPAKAQTIIADSAKIVAQAVRDAAKFRLIGDDLQKFNAMYFPAGSDHFKPVARNISNAALLTDSLYVKTYRNRAFYAAVKQPGPSSFGKVVHPPHTPSEMQRPVYPTANEQLAQKDARKFSLTQKELKKFRAEYYPNTSDYFRPTAAMASYPSLLNDSDYVKTFKNEAFYNSYNRRHHPVGHALLIVGSILVGITLILVLIAITITVNVGY